MKNMKYRYPFCLLLLPLLFSMPACRKEHTPIASATQATVPSSELAKLSQQYLELRHIKGHWQGGEWIAEVDSWNERKHQIMVRLGDLLGQPGGSQDDIIYWMGPPDRQEQDKLIYWWRGNHDYLIFWLDKGQVTLHQWHHDYE